MEVPAWALGCKLFRQTPPLLVERNFFADKEGKAAFVRSAQHVGCEACLLRALGQGNHNILVGGMLIGNWAGVVRSGLVSEFPHSF